MSEEKKGHFINRIYFPFLLLSMLLSISCSRAHPRICIKDGRQYCLTSDRIQVITWDACYRRGESCMRGQCWDYALEEFKEAINLRYRDQRLARAYGMHFREEYFPHRELGICLFHLGMITEAWHELELSLSQTPSARAKYYLNLVRRSYLLETGLDSLPPVIHVAFPQNGYLTNRTPLTLKGSVRDEQYVAAISVNQKPLFIELAEPSLPFSTSVDLQEGWNILQVSARDLVGREVHENIKVYLDQQGPQVMIGRLKPDQSHPPDQIRVIAVAFDQSGIVSFKMNGKEIPRAGLDQFCLIEQSRPLSAGEEPLSFRVQDGAGNVSQGHISFPALADEDTPDMRLACRELADLTWPARDVASRSPGEEAITFDITHPPKESMTTCYHETFLEGIIKTQEGIRRIELNGKQLFDSSELQAVLEKNSERLWQRLLKQNKNPETYLRLFREIIRNHRVFHINQRIPLRDEVTDLLLLAEDKAGNRTTKHFSIRKVPRDTIFKSEQLMTMAILPPDVSTAGETDLQQYVYNKLIEFFIQYGRFSLVERERLPWVLIEKALQAEGKSFQDGLAQKIGETAAAEGIICGYLQKREDGLEIMARFIEVETGFVRLFHDVFTPFEDLESLTTIISGLAMKFRDSFPMCSGTITARRGNTFQVDLGSEKGIFPGMAFNIFEDEQELIGQANITEVAEDFSEARIRDRGEPRRDRGESTAIHVGCRVRTR